MSTTRSKVFVFCNELTRCIEAVEKVKENAVLVREVLANMKRHRMQAEKCMMELTKVCKPRMQGMRSVSPSHVVMLLSMYTAFPDMAETSVMDALVNAKIENMDVCYFTVLACTAVVKNNVRIRTDCFISRYFEQWIGKSAAADYAFVDLLYTVSEKHGIKETHIKQLEEYVSGETPLSLTPKLILMVIHTQFRYKIPVEAFDVKNMSNGYIRVMDAISQVCRVCEKEKVVSLLQYSEKEFATMFTPFLDKQAVGSEHKGAEIPKTELFVSSAVQEIRRVVESRKTPEEVVESIRRILEYHGKKEE